MTNPTNTAGEMDDDPRPDYYRGHHVRCDIWPGGLGHCTCCGPLSDAEAAAELDVWRWDRSRIFATTMEEGGVCFNEHVQFFEYRRLVRENITPEAGD